MLGIIEDAQGRFAAFLVIHPNRFPGIVGRQIATHAFEKLLVHRVQLNLIVFVERRDRVAGRRGFA